MPADDDLLRVCEIARHILADGERAHEVELPGRTQVFRAIGDQCEEALILGAPDHWQGWKLNASPDWIGVLVVGCLHWMRCQYPGGRRHLTNRRWCAADGA